MTYEKGNRVITEYGAGEIVSIIRTFDADNFSFGQVYKVRLDSCPRLLTEIHEGLGGLLFDEKEINKKGEIYEKENDVCAHCSLI